MDVSANCISEILCLEIDIFDLNMVHKPSCKDKTLGRAGIQTMLPLCYAAPLTFVINHHRSFVMPLRHFWFRAWMSFHNYLESFLKALGVLNLALHKAY